MVYQPRVAVDSLAARVQSVEHIIYPRAVDLLASGRLELRGGRAHLDDEPLAEPLTIPFMEATAP